MILPATIVAVVAFGITLLLSNLSFFTFLELKGLDLLFVLRGPLPSPDPIVIVAIDEPSMSEIGRQWPWPRSLHARLTQQLNKAGAKVIGFDILFAEPSEPAEDEEFPIPAFRDAAAVGSPLVSIDADGTVRRARLLAPDMPSFALQVVRRYLGNPAAGTAAATEAKWLKHRDLSPAFSIPSI